MRIIDKTINLQLKKDFTPFKKFLENLVKEFKLDNANIICWVPHEVSSIVQLGWEDGLIDDMRDILEKIAPPNTYKKHDEPGTPFRYNFYEHVRTKLIGNVSKTFIVKDGSLFLGKYQDLYFYSPVWKNIPNQQVFCRIVIFD